jgi:putative ABC transport system permease protein
MTDMNPERWLHVIPLRLRSLFRRDDVERELEDELRDHVECETQENIRRGMSPDAARAAALRRFGGVAYHKERVRDARGTRGVEEFARDLVFALRSLRRAPGFTTAVVITLGLGIGANTAMFTVLRGTLLRSLSNRDDRQLVYLRQSASGVGQQNETFSVPEIADFRAGVKAFSRIAEASAMSFTMVGDDGFPERISTGVVSGNYFDVMGLDAVAGRVMTERDDGKDAAPVVVLSSKFWVKRFGGDASVIGKRININSILATVVGVVEPVTPFPQPTDVYANLVTSPHHLGAAMVTSRTHRMTEVFARLAPGASVEHARLETATVASRMFLDHPDQYEKAARYTVSVTPLRDAINAKAKLTVWLLMAAAAFVLLIACANVTNLTLMRAVGRERELIVRAALGAGRWRLRRLLLAENLTLTLAGGALGVGMAVAGMKMLISFAAQLTPRAEEVHIDGVVLAVCLGTSVVAAVALSYVSRIGGGSESLVPPASLGSRATLGRRRQRFQRLLVITHVGVCMILLTGAGLLVRTLAKLDAVDVGVRVDHVLTVELPFNYSSGSQKQQQFENQTRLARYRDRVAALPGVAMVAMGDGVPLSSERMAQEILPDSRPLAPGEAIPRAITKSVDARYFEAAGMRVVAGRTFTLNDIEGAAPVVIMTQGFAKRLFGHANPVGQRIAWTGWMKANLASGSEASTIVGIAADTHDDGVDAPPTPTVFLPLNQGMVYSGVLVIRSQSDPATLAPAVLHAIREVWPQQLIEKVRTLEAIRDKSVAPRRLNAIFLMSFAGLALVIAMVGIGAVLAFSVSSRVHEIGIRMSIGADAASVRRMVLWEGGVLLGVGVVFGFAGALAAARLLRGLLFGVGPNDPFTLGVVAVALTGIGLAACWLPAARAARVDPAVALRAE